MIGQSELGKCALGELYAGNTRTDAERGGRLILVKRAERKKPESGKRTIVRGGKRR